jgi:hypothetical protein
MITKDILSPHCSVVGVRCEVVFNPQPGAVAVNPPPVQPPKFIKPEVPPPAPTACRVVVIPTPETSAFCLINDPDNDGVFS